MRRALHRTHDADADARGGLLEQECSAGRDVDILRPYKKIKSEPPTVRLQPNISDQCRVSHIEHSDQCTVSHIEIHEMCCYGLWHVQ